MSTDLNNRPKLVSEFAARRKATVIRSEEEAIAIAHDFAKLIASGAADRDRQRAVPLVELGQLAETGLLGITVPAAYGGLGASARTVAEVFRIIAEADPAIAQVPQNHFVFTDVVIHEGTQEQKDELLAMVLEGKRFGNALAERGTKHSGERKTRIVPDKDGFRVNGTKYYCTGAYSSDIIPVTALDAEGRPVVAYVDRNAPGVEVGQDWTAMGQRATISGTTVLDNVFVPKSRVIEHWRRYEAPQVHGAFAQIIHAAIFIGVGSAALKDGAAFVREKARPYFEAGVEKAGEDSLLLHQFGQLFATLHAAEALLERAADTLDRAAANLNAETAAAASIAVSEAKAFGGDTAVKIASDVFALTGTSSADEKYRLDRHWRNVRTHTLHDPARWKFWHVGNYHVNRKKPPSHGLI